MDVGGRDRERFARDRRSGDQGDQVAETAEMAVDQEKLRATLKELHRQLSDVEATDDVRGLLETVQQDVEKALEHDPESDEEHTIRERLLTAALEFEESHPELSGVLGSTIDALGRMGI